MEQYFATCPRGLEQALATELAAIGARDAGPVDGGVAFAGDLALAYAANLESRIASRVLWKVGQASYRDEHDVFDAARAIAWSRLFDVQRTIRVNVSAIRAPLKSLDFVTLRVKDAVCDVFREARGSRPDVNTATPDVRIHVFLTQGEATFYLDTSGEALFKRGWRTAGGDAPLRENLAAGILKLAGWAGPTPLYDPMCGSGTFLVEAAMMSLDAAPGLGRSFGFERLENFDEKRWRSMRERAQGRRRPATALEIAGSEKSGTALGQARANLAAAGIEDAVRLKQMDILDGSPPLAPGVAVLNPPYGERLGEKDSLAAFYPRLGDTLKQRYAGWAVYIFTADLRLPKLIGLKASRRTPLYNGALECRLFEYRMISGSLRRARSGEA